MLRRWLHYWSRTVCKLEMLDVIRMLISDHFPLRMEVSGWECLPGNKHHMLGLCKMTIIACMVRCSLKLGDTRSKYLDSVHLPVQQKPFSWSRWKTSSQSVLAAISQCVLVKGALSDTTAKWGRSLYHHCLCWYGYLSGFFIQPAGLNKNCVRAKLNSPWHPLIKLDFY